MRGYVQDNGLRETIVKGENCDVVTLVETHLSGDNYVNISGYKCFQHNRQLRHFRAKSSFGGLCILVKNCLFEDYTIDIVDKSHEGILAALMKNKVSGYEVLLIACYLPPANSNWGRDASEFFAHILILIYQFASDTDAIYVTGDLNSRIGNACDFIPEIDSVTERVVIDKVKNKHGNELIEFLLEAKMIVCNGRITPCQDNFTCIEPAKGASVVDYFITEIENFNLCKELTVVTARQLIDKHCDADSTDVNIGRNIPDHSFLKLKVLMSKSIGDETSEMNDSDSSVLFEGNARVHREVYMEPPLQENSFDNTLNTGINEGHEYFNRYRINDSPPSLLDDSMMLELIRDVENTRNSQRDIDYLYDKFSMFYHEELKRRFGFYNVHKVSKKTSKRCRKPFWNEELKNLWKDLCQKERLFLKSVGRDRMRKRDAFKFAQKSFDKCYRREERKYHRERLLKIEELTDRDPNKFWKYIRNLGPRKKQDIPMEVYNSEGNIVTERKLVLDRWRSDYSKLFSHSTEDEGFDDEFLNFCRIEMRNLEHICESFPHLSDDISENEVNKCVSKAKNKKAVGIDNLPNEIFKNKKSNRLLKDLFNKMFGCGFTPSMWKLAVIKPIPKNSLSDPRLPLQYRGISLLSTIYKMYSTILNWRLIKVAENNKLFCEEQNGFRKNRSCQDHVYSLTSIIRNQKNSRKSTYVCYVDFEKAFDKVDRDLLFYKLRKMKIGGKLLESIRTVYTDCFACVNVNNYCTDWFETNYGVRQGDPLSPTLFGLYINDLAESINGCENNINLGDFKVNILMYADDVALISDSEANLQSMLNKLGEWCKKWRLKVNIGKTNIIHFRTKSQVSTNYSFTLGNKSVKIVSSYKYLGVLFSEYLDYGVIVDQLASSGKRALGAIYSKFRQQKGLGCNTFSKLYHTGVVPILDYCAGVWGFKKFEKIDSVQNKAIRLFLGVHGYAPNLAIQGDMGWVCSHTRRKTEMIRYWNRLLKMEDGRIPKKILRWEMEKRGANWAAEVRNLLDGIGKEGDFYNMQLIDLNDFKNKICFEDKENWKKYIGNVPKLRSYILFKNEMQLEAYVYKVINRGHRSTLAQLRCGILPLRVETGRYISIPLEYRLCLMCSENKIEDENHFLFECTCYQNMRISFLANIFLKYPLFDSYSFGKKCQIIMNEEMVKETAAYVYNIYQCRRKILYS